MDFELTDEQQLIRDAVREFAEAEVAPIAAEIDRDHRFPARAPAEDGGAEHHGHALPRGSAVVRERTT